MVTLKFIAEKVGVSIQTVSNVVNNKDAQVGIQTKKIILDLLQKYGYTPNRSAKSLRRGSTKTIGLIVPDIVHYPIYSEVFDIFEEELSNNWFDLLLFNSRENLEREERAINKLIEHDVDGAIIIRIAGKNETKNNYYFNLSRKKIPIIGCIREFYDTDVVSILTDNKKVGYLATEYLIKNGHKEILHISGDFSLKTHRDRFDGYKAALKDNKIKFHKNKMISLDYKDQNLNNKIIEIVQNQKNYTAIFTYTDLIGVGFIKIFNYLGIDVPDDVSIIGVDNLKVGNYTKPNLTSISQPIKKICSNAVNLLLKMISNSKQSNNKKKIILYTPQLVIKKSVKNIRN